LNPEALQNRFMQLALAIWAIGRMDHRWTRRSFAGGTRFVGYAVRFGNRPLTLALQHLVGSAVEQLNQQEYHRGNDQNMNEPFEQNVQQHQGNPERNEEKRDSDNHCWHL
jgi:hypothetical protein